ncbi:MAG: 23S rRNA (adenine(2503)-C(2))-methyltransferase RlmN [Dehalococcoidales bacterium]|nr:23S rRNA (adenine(2503)-C(2))-methyltransferase RlmN [Dehalococcoidales bacterium]
MTKKPQSFTELNYAQSSEFLLALGEPAYRVKQVAKWVYRNMAQDFAEMTDLPQGLRQKLSDSLKLHSISPAKQEIGRDGTVKTLFNLADGKTVETALMHYDPERGGERYTVCVSTQVGCAVGCPFCATGQQGFERNLTPGEIIDQVLYFARYLMEKKNGSSGKHVSNVVFMGMGEPLANYDNLWRAIEMLNSPEAFGLGARNMVISTAGLVPQIKRLAKEKLQVGLAISLHAADNALRNKLVPLNRRYPLEQLIPACREYIEVKGKRLSFEYALFRGVNASIGHARALADLIGGLKCHINLIAANVTADPAFQPPPRQVILAFEDELKRLHLNVTLRERRGQDINAGCGQLRSQFLKNKER